MTFFTILSLITMFVIYKTIIIVPQHSGVVKERLGKFKGVLLPGFHFLIPFFDRIAYSHEMREQVLDVPSQSCITKDNIQVEVDGIVYLKVISPDKASYGIGDYRLASVNLAQTNMRSEIGKLTLDETFSERESINENVVREVDLASDPWGIKVMRYEIKNISPSDHVVDTLEKQMEAERQKRAEITLAEAGKQSTINLSNAYREEKINISEGEKKKRMNEAQGKAREISILAEATAEGLGYISAAIAKKGGQEALQMQISEQFIDELGKILKTAEVSVVPSNLANLKGFFEGLNQVGNTISNKKEV
ncbi:MAG: paraslipin [Deltaproteobacteria bacterium]|nr:paraslipin [Deltaproteobacteria bacterium]